MKEFKISKDTYHTVHEDFRYQGVLTENGDIIAVYFFCDFHKDDCDITMYDRKGNTIGILSI